MWRARYSVPPDWRLELVVLGLDLGVGDRVLLLVVGEQLADQDGLARELHLRLVVGRGGQAALLGFLHEHLAQHDLVAHLRSSSGVRCWLALACVACCISASTRALGTALPLTMAMFCACAASGSEQRDGQRQQRRATARDSFSWADAFHDGMGGGESAARMRGAMAGSSVRLARGAGVDGQRVDALRHQRREGIIYEAMPRHP